MGSGERSADSERAGRRAFVDSTTDDSVPDEREAGFAGGRDIPVETGGIVDGACALASGRIEASPGRRKIAMTFSLQCPARLPPRSRL